MSNLRINPSNIYTICVNCRSAVKKGLLQKDAEIIPVTKRSFLYITDHNRPYYWYDEETKTKKKAYQQSGPISLCETCSYKTPTINCSQLVKDYLIEVHRILDEKTVKTFDSWFHELNPPYMLHDDPIELVKIYMMYNDVFAFFKEKDTNIKKESYDGWAYYNLTNLGKKTYKELYESYLEHLKI